MVDAGHAGFGRYSVHPVTVISCGDFLSQWFPVVIPVMVTSFQKGVSFRVRHPTAESDMEQVSSEGNMVTRRPLTGRHKRVKHAIAEFGFW